jgi:ribosomal protein S18 acetylase RimI-like enzyme
MLPPALHITIATVADAQDLTDLSIRTFVDAFSKDNKKEDMDKYIADEMSVEKLAAELADSNNTFFLAHNKKALTGYAKVRSIKKPEALKNNNPLEIERIYVLQQHHGTKTGAALMQRCIDYALQHKHDVIWLGVWEHNTPAVNFYKKWGFDFFGSHNFRLGDDIQTDVLMRKML